MWLSDKPQVVGSITSDVANPAWEMGQHLETGGVSYRRLPLDGVRGYLPDNHS